MILVTPLYSIIFILLQEETVGLNTQLQASVPPHPRASTVPYIYLIPDDKTLNGKSGPQLLEIFLK